MAYAELSYAEAAFGGEQTTTTAATATISGTVPGLTGSLAGTVVTVSTGTADGTIAPLTGSLSGSVVTPGTLAGSVPALTGSLAGVVLDVITAALDGHIAALSGSLSGSVLDPGTGILDGVVPALSGSLAGDVADANAGALDGTIAALTGSLSGDVVTFAVISGHVPALNGTLTALVGLSATIDGHVPALTGSLSATGVVDGTFDGHVPALSGSLVATFPPQTERQRGSGRLRRGIGVGFYTPPVVAPPTFTVAQHAFVTARSYGSATMAGTRPVFADVHSARARRAFDRVLVGGRDVTYYRGVHTPAPSYALVVPLLYGTATLNLPQVSAVFEQPGVGELRWARKGAPVLVQRVDPDTLAVLATDYKGFVVAHDISGPTLTLEIAGEATGRAALIDKQPPLFFKRNDLGFWWWGGITDLGLKFEPRPGPDLGIRLRNAGGMDHLSYLQGLSANGVRRTGAQLTCMPDAHEAGGAYRVVEKDLETIHATVYLDDNLSIPDVRDDLAEQPNRVFATSVSPSGMRVKFGAYPVLRDATPPPYPFHDHRHFGTGTTDADTDTGDGVSVMIWRLVKAGYLDLIDKPGGFDSDVADAIRDLKLDALSGPSFIDGDMTPKAWDALFDASATGYSLAGTQILPAAQDAKTRKWDRTSNGSVIGRNTSFDPSVIPVDTTVDMGVGITRRQDRVFARGELAPVGGSDYVGTVTLNSGAVIRGEHTPGDNITEADLMDARELRPGMNLWAPLFMGGTLLHIAGVDRSVDGAGSSTIRLDVDTRARDTMKVWEVIRRNRESRRNPARAWLNQHRSSALTKDSIAEFDEIGGVLDDRVDLAAGEWTVFPVVAGQEGTIRSLRIETSPPTEFVVAVFGREIKSSRLAALIGDPLTEHGTNQWSKVATRTELDDDHVLLYVVGGAGDTVEPCGYFPGKKTGAESFLTGVWEDDAGFSYHTFNAPVLWVAMWAADATHLNPGRIMWPQLESGS